MVVQMVPAEHWMIPQILENLRGDQLEVVTDRTSLATDLQAKIEISSHCMVGTADGNIAVIWGVLTPSITSGLGVVWAITTTHADKYPLVFARWSAIAIEDIRKSYAKLTGYVNADYKRSVRWLGWLGFNIGPSQIIHGVRVRKIEMKGEL